MSETVAHLDTMTQQNAELAVSTSTAANNLAHQMEQLRALMDEFIVHGQGGYRAAHGREQRLPMRRAA